MSLIPHFLKVCPNSSEPLLYSCRPSVWALLFYGVGNLTDNEERSLYNTSPFLEDSDSDGLTDRQEIENGTDPNCATGQACETQATPLNTANNLVATSTINPTIITNSNVVTGDDDLQLMMSGQANVAQLRTMLLESGADANMLQQLSDEELLKTYKEMLAEQGATTQQIFKYFTDNTCENYE